MSNQTSFIDLPLLYAFGLVLRSFSNTTLVVGPGQARTKGNEFDIILSESATVIDATKNGPNGLDVGTLQPNTWYAVHLIYDSTLKLPTATIISCQQKTTGNFSAGPILPYGYSHYRRIGYVLTDASSHFIPFAMAVNNSAGIICSRYYQWASPIQVLNGGISSTFASVSLSGAVPYNQLGIINLSFTHESSLNTDTGSIRPNGSGTPVESSAINFSGVVEVGTRSPNFPCVPIVVTNLINGFPSIDYAITGGSIDIWVNGFYDNI